MKWINPEVALPPNGLKVIIIVRNSWDKRHMTVAEYIHPRTVLAEDFLDPDSDFSDVADDGTEYAPGGWYEMPLMPDENYYYYISDTVEWWMRAPEQPAERGATRRAA